MVLSPEATSRFLSPNDGRRYAFEPLISARRHERVNSFRFGMRPQIRDNPILRPTTADGENPMRRMQRLVFHPSQAGGRSENFMRKTLTTGMGDAMSVIKSRRKQKLVISAGTLLTRLNGYLPTVRGMTIPLAQVTTTANVGQPPMSAKAEAAGIAEKQRRTRKASTGKEDVLGLNVSGIGMVTQPNEDILEGYEEVFRAAGRRKGRDGGEHKSKV